MTADLYEYFLFARLVLNCNVANAFVALNMLFRDVQRAIEDHGATGPHAAGERVPGGMERICTIGEKGRYGGWGREVDKVMRGGNAGFVKEGRVRGRGRSRVLGDKVGETKGEEVRRSGVGVVVEGREATGSHLGVEMGKIDG